MATVGTVRRRIGDALFAHSGFPVVPFAERAVDGPTLDVVRFGSCEGRAMDRQHASDAPVGWPQAMADELARDGVRMRFKDRYVLAYEELPQTTDDLLARARTPWTPDLVVVQVGAIYAALRILPVHRRSTGLRQTAGRRLGRSARPVIRVSRMTSSLVGRPFLPYAGTACLERFLDAVAAAWPAAEVLVLPPYRGRLWRSPRQRRTSQAVRADLLALASARGLHVHEEDHDVLSAAEMRCFNGYNLSARGSALVGERLAAWARVSGQAAAARTAAWAAATRATGTRYGEHET